MTVLFDLLNFEVLMTFLLAGRSLRMCRTKAIAIMYDVMSTHVKAVTNLDVVKQKQKCLKKLPLIVLSYS